MPKRLTLALGLYFILAMGAAAQQAATYETPDSATEECTTGVASGRATADGRPILWKNRDNSAAMNNEVNYFTDGKYNYLAVVTVGQPGSAWMGVNEKGFCIENSVISDLPRGGRSGAGNGGFMKLALQTCANLDDFEALLKATNVSGRRTLANFGVIDAEGGAAIFETSHVDYVKFDANDPAVAPDGYIVRANFTMTGNEARGGDRDTTDRRYLRGDAICQLAVDAGKLDHAYILRNFSRDLADPRGTAYPGSINANGRAAEPLPRTITTDATISRKSTVSVAVFHGVKPGEDPRLTTMWTILGEPVFSVAVPCWVEAGAAPELDGPQTSPLCSAVLEMKNASYAEGRSLRTGWFDDIWSITFPREDRILEAAAGRLALWRASYPGAEAVASFHGAMAAEAMAGVTAARDAVIQGDRIRRRRAPAPAPPLFIR